MGNLYSIDIHILCSAILIGSYNHGTLHEKNVKVVKIFSRNLIEKFLYTDFVHVRGPRADTVSRREVLKIGKRGL